jgi:hypothetical protein
MADGFMSGLLNEIRQPLYEVSQSLVAIAPLLTAFGAILTGVGAWATFVLISRRTIQLTWVVGFRELYAEFWRDESIAVARRWITSDVEYEEVKGVLSARNKCRQQNTLNSDDNKKLDSIDRFLAVLLSLAFRNSGSEAESLEDSI